MVDLDGAPDLPHDVEAWKRPGFSRRRRLPGRSSDSTIVHCFPYRRTASPLVTPADQNELMDIIRAVKRGDSGPRNREHFANIAHDLRRGSVDMLLIACTELSVLADSLDQDFPALDALEILAREIVAFGLGDDRADCPCAAPISGR